MMAHWLNSEAFNPKKPTTKRNRTLR